ncbi:hypothetical protein [Nonomuraea sp. NPDC049684]|uniref:hypothetical protein n=1 Tax=Nonomuraea sp. NPDC049684 TaxID=3364356 RepID=UPI0037BCFC49
MAGARAGWWREHGRPLDQERVALAHRLALHAADLRGDDPVKARDLGLAALGVHADDRLRGYPSEVRGAALSDGARGALPAAPDSATFSLWDLHDLRQVVAGPEQILCDNGPRTLSRTDWDRYTGGADPSDHGGGDQDVNLCSLR